MVPLIAISRAVLMHPMAMVARPGVDAEHPVHAADRATNRAADDTSNWTGGGIAFSRTSFHPAWNSLCLSRERRGEQSREHSDFEFLLPVLRVLFDRLKHTWQPGSSKAATNAPIRRSQPSRRPADTSGVASRTKHKPGDTSKATKSPSRDRQSSAMLSWLKTDVSFAEKNSSALEQPGRWACKKCVKQRQ
jgi:hypothetical protein